MNSQERKGPGPDNKRPQAKIVSKEGLTVEEAIVIARRGGCVLVDGDRPVVGVVEPAKAKED